MSFSLQYFHLPRKSMGLLQQKRRRKRETYEALKIAKNGTHEGSKVLKKRENNGYFDARQ
jgi:hypothetical protein